MIARQPELSTYRFRMGKPTRLGNVMSIVGDNFAVGIDNEGLLQMAIDCGLPESQVDMAKRAIDVTGFTRRFFYRRPEDKVNVEGTVRRSVEIGSVLLREAITAQGWKGNFDVFIDTSAFLPTTINREIVEMAGFNPDRKISRSYRYACAGAVGAFIDCLADPTLSDARIVIGALEPLSVFLDRSQFLTPAGLAFPSIFSEAFTAVAFTPRDFQLEDQQILIQPDGGVIKLMTLYDFDNEPSDPDSIPPHYRFANGGKAIFRHSKSSAVLKILTPDNGRRASMDGVGTGLFFGNETAAVIRNRLDQSDNPDLFRQLNGKNVILHPASKPVVDRIAKLLCRGEHKYLDSPELPFLMDKAEQANGSSATTFNRLRYMVRKNLIDLNDPMVWVAPGIGSAIVYGRVRVVCP